MLVSPWLLEPAGLVVVSMLERRGGVASGWPARVLGRRLARRLVAGAVGSWWGRGSVGAGGARGGAAGRQGGARGGRGLRWVSGDSFRAGGQRGRRRGMQETAGAGVGACGCLACSAGTWQGWPRWADRLGEVGLGVLVVGAVGRLDGEAMGWLVGGVGQGEVGGPVPTVSH